MPLSAKRISPLFLALLLALFAALSAPAPVAAKIVRASVHSSGAEANSYSFAPLMSATGNTVSFYSYATNLVTPNVGGKQHYSHDLGSGVTTLLALDEPEFAAPPEDAPPPVLAADPEDLADPVRTASSCFLAYESYDDGIVAHDTNVMADVFVYDCGVNQTTRVSVDSAGRQGNANSYAPSISADGRYVAFYSYASNLVPGDTNGKGDVFVHDRWNRATFRISLDANGLQANDNSFDPSVSANGRWVAFRSRASNLVPGDTKGQTDIFVHGPLPAASIAPITLLLLSGDK